MVKRILAAAVLVVSVAAVPAAHAIKPRVLIDVHAGGRSYGTICIQEPQPFGCRIWTPSR